MRNKAQLTRTATIGLAAIFVAAGLFLGTTNNAAAAGTASLCEGTITASTSSALPAGHFFSVGLSTTVSKTKDCQIATGTSTEVIDAACGGQTPCVVSGSNTTVIAQTTNCTPLIVPPSTTSTPGSAAIAFTSGPLNGCVQVVEIFPIAKLSGGYSVGVLPIIQNPTSGSATCPAVNTTGIITCTLQQ